MAGISQSNVTSSGYVPGKNYTGPLTVITTLFFMWAVATNLNDILIPHLKKACNLTDFQSSFVQSAFFLGYFLLSLPAGIVIKKVGYKNGILIGLVTCAVGSLLFIPAAETRVYGFFLFALCMIAGGIAFLQVAANPYVTVLGKPETASSRLNLAQAFNSLGASLGPYVGGMLILSEVEKTAAQLNAMSAAELEAYRIAEAGMVKMPYLGLALIFLAIAALIYFSKLPEIQEEKESPGASEGSISDVFKFKHCILGVIAIFVYVGAEVGIGSFIIRYIQYLQIPDTVDPSKLLSEKSASKFISFYMAGAMIGRFIGSALMQKLNPAKILAFNAIMAAALALASMFSSGLIALILIVAIGLFNSIMFPTIFTLSIHGLGKYTKYGSSLLIMAIVGGGIVPPIMGYISDIRNIQVAFLVPVICYAYIFFFGIKGSTPTHTVAVDEVEEPKDVKVALDANV
ncbi:MAG: L-fucose:H+ symporter permease [Cytophagaceae bacterium]